MPWSGFGLHRPQPLRPRCGAFPAPLPSSPWRTRLPLSLTRPGQLAGRLPLSGGSGLLLGLRGDPVPHRAPAPPGRVCASVPPPGLGAEAAAVCKPAILSGASCLAAAGPHPQGSAFPLPPSHSLQHRAVRFPDKANESTGCYLWGRAGEHKRPLSLRLPALPDRRVSPLVVFTTF